MNHKHKSVFLKLPEYYFIIMAILAGYTPPFGFNPITIGVALLLLAQIIFRNRISGIALGGIFFTVNLLFLGALLSEFNEFAKSTDDAQSLIFVGMAIWIANLAFSVTMVFHYSKKGHGGQLTPQVERG